MSNFPQCRNSPKILYRDLASNFANLVKQFFRTAEIGLFVVNIGLFMVKMKIMFFSLKPCFSKTNDIPYLYELTFHVSWKEPPRF